MAKKRSFTAKNADAVKRSGAEKDLGVAKNLYASKKTAAGSHPSPSHDSGLTLEQKKEKVKDFRPIDDVFFECLASRKPVCQEILRTILEDPELIVLDVIVQCDERNLYGRSVRLDALCTLGVGRKVNIEVQRSNDDDHLRRVRFNASSITVKESHPGDTFRQVLELYVIYLSEKDFLHEEKAIYHVDKILRETGTVIDDGLHEIFVNAQIKDSTDISELMSCFMEKNVRNPKFPALSEGVTELKETEGGISSMCQIMQHYEEQARQDGIKLGLEQGHKQGLQQGTFLALCGLVHDGLLSASEAAKRSDMTEDIFVTKMNEQYTNS